MFGSAFGYTYPNDASMETVRSAAAAVAIVVVAHTVEPVLVLVLEEADLSVEVLCQLLHAVMAQFEFQNSKAGAKLKLTVLGTADSSQ